MLRVSLSRKIRPEEFESAGFEIDITSESYPTYPDETPEEWVKRAHLFCYKQLLMYEAFHGRSVEDATRELRRFKKAYGIHSGNSEESGK